MGFWFVAMLLLYEIKLLNVIVLMAKHLFFPHTAIKSQNRTEIIKTNEEFDSAI